MSKEQHCLYDNVEMLKVWVMLKQQYWLFDKDIKRGPCANVVFYAMKSGASSG
jgi:hypothetical protein